ncbi:probable serine/threonine-protein kinase dyrk1 [Metopolophium dirhodum]|uniref:probable serine/threonine-protein kinase dyrk1 n=1 Tax=Metopolophium dirhodum TaxID=44670 RepID=UPI00298FF7A2|nr:probable serine/threonine-protein kinase dyrk1 [Metopolophium dirhodum]
MAEGESVAKFASRIEELYYKLCAASTIGLAQAEADIVKKQTKKQAMIIFMTGLPHHLYTALESRNPSTLEQCFNTAIDEMLEYESKVEMDKLQRQIGNGKQADVNNEEKLQNGGNTNNAVNRGGNRNSNQSNRNNNFNGHNNRYVNHNNRNNYGNNNQSGYGSHMVNRGGYRGGNGYGRNFNTNNVQQNNINQGTGCYTCGRSNHIARDCWSNRPNAQQNTYNNNRVSGTRHANNNNNVRRDNNNTQGVLCSYCNKIGHEISNCYIKQKNERSTSGNANGPSPVGVRLVQEIVQDPHTGFSTSQQN